jgi:voltage-gated potassium channel
MPEESESVRSPNPPKFEEAEFGIFQMVMLVLSVYVIAVFTVETTISDLSPETQQALDYTDFAVCIFFLADFIIRFCKAPSKLGYMKWGWIDLLSSFPVLPFINHTAWLRAVRILRILRAFRSVEVIVGYLYHHRARAGIVSMVLISFFIVVFGAVAELNFEKADPINANIKSADDALWWALSTITTVACEKYPVTDGGRLVAIFMMCAGVLLCGTVSAYMASVFLEPLQKKEESELQELLAEMKLLRAKIDSIEKSTSELLGSKK